MSSAEVSSSEVKPLEPFTPSRKEDSLPPAVEHKDYDEVEIENADGTVLNQDDIAKTIRKMDIVVLPIMTIVLAFCFIDRSNMGLAMVVGMGKELHFKTYEYSIALLVFFPGYALFVLPSNYILSKTSVRYWLTFLSIAFGLFTVASGLVRSFSGLAAIRAFLGVCEAGYVFPSLDPCAVVVQH